MNESTIQRKSIAQAVLLAMLLTLLAYIAWFYIHESGHIGLALVGHFMNNNLSSNITVVWMQLPILPISVPQRTHIDGQTLSTVVYGGSYMAVFAAIVVYAIIQKWSNLRNKDYAILIPAVILLHEYIGDYLCGTDNLTGNALTDCRGVLWIVSVVSFYLLIPVIAFLIYPEIKKRVAKN